MSIAIVADHNFLPPREAKTAGNKTKAKTNRDET
jgi:hypothetical protein